MADNFDNMDKRRARRERTQLSDADMQQVQQGAHLRPDRPVNQIPHRGPQGFVPNRPTEKQLNAALESGNFKGFDLTGDFSTYQSLAHLKNETGQVSARELVTTDAMHKHAAMTHLQKNPHDTPAGANHVAEKRLETVKANGGINLDNTNLTGANLSNANIYDYNRGMTSSLQGANLTNANLSKANLVGANFTGATLTNANMQEARITHAEMAGITAPGLDLSKANISQVRMHNSDLTGAKFNGTTLDSVTLDQSNLTNAKMGTAHLTGTTDIQTAQLNGTEMPGSVPMRPIKEAPKNDRSSRSIG